MKNLFIIILLVLESSCNAKDRKNIDAKDLISKKYFVKGMTCGGCIVGVKTVLNKSTELKIADKDIKVGEATLRFEKKNYKKSTTDCDVTKTIESVTEFKVFIDRNHTKKACES